MQKTIFVTGTPGRTSSYVVRALLEQMDPSHVRLLAHSPASAETIHTSFPSIPESNVFVGDYFDNEALAKALQGVQIVFHNGPAFHPLESAMGISLIEAAKKAGVQTFVYCSVLFSVLRRLENHDCKRYVEEHLIESGLDYTILQPSSYMQNIPISQALSSGTLMCPYTPTVLQGFLDLSDLAVVTRNVPLSPEAHSRARYDLVGENTTLAAVAETLARVGGKDIRYKRVSREETIAHFSVMDEHGKEEAERMLFYYDKRGIPGNDNIARWLLGREPTGWEEAIRREMR